VAASVGTELIDDTSRDAGKSILDGLASADFVHIACHGAAARRPLPREQTEDSQPAGVPTAEAEESTTPVDGNDPLARRAPSEAHLLIGDGYLRLSDFERAVGDHAPRFVALTACSVGLVGADEQLVGIPSSLLAMGVEAVLAPLWPIGDRSTAAMIVVTYEHWLAGATIGEALSAARAHPAIAGNANLAGLQLFGNPDLRLPRGARPIDLTEGATTPGANTASRTKEHQ
jgi:hypothetical protein